MSIPKQQKHLLCIKQKVSEYSAFECYIITVFSPACLVYYYYEVWPNRQWKVFTVTEQTLFSPFLLHFCELLCFVYSESHVICSCSEAFSFTHMLLATFTTMQTRQWRCLNYNDNNNPHHLHSLITSACFTTYENKLVLHSTVVSLSVHYAHIGVHTRKAGNFLHCLHRIQKCTLIIFQHIRGWSSSPPPRGRRLSEAWYVHWECWVKTCCVGRAEGSYWYVSNFFSHNFPMDWHCGGETECTNTLSVSRKKPFWRCDCAAIILLWIFFKSEQSTVWRTFQNLCFSEFWAFAKIHYIITNY